MPETVWTELDLVTFGDSLKVTGDFLYSIAVCVSIFTTLFTPYLINLIRLYGIATEIASHT